MADKKPHYVEHRKRLRERFGKTGSVGLHDYELLELLLTYAVPRRDVKPLAKNLMKDFGSIAGVLDATPADLQARHNVGPASATLIRLIKELAALYLDQEMRQKDVVASPKAVIEFVRLKLSALSHETFMVVFLNIKNEVIDYELIHEGTVDRAVIYPRRVIESALTKHASGVILVHNHPSGHPEPSAEDKRLTRSVVEAARTIDLKVLDHLIVGKGGYFSFVENQLMTRTLDSAASGGGQ